MRVLFSTGSAANYMSPPVLGDEQINCGPDWPAASDSQGRVRSFTTPAGEYDLAALAVKLPRDQHPDLVVCLVDASWRNVPRNLAAFRCPRVLLVADTHHLRTPLIGMMRYLNSEPFDRVVFLYDRHHIALFRSAGFRNLYWFPGLTFPHTDAVVRSARQSASSRTGQIAFVGQVGAFHPRRTRLIDALKAAPLPVAVQPLPQSQALGFYGASLLGFNASLNGDLNLRVFEILASGAALLTDRLAPDSGLETLFTDGTEIGVYGDAVDLRNLAQNYLERPADAAAMGAAGAAWFDRVLNERRRREVFRALAVDGLAVPEFDFEPTDLTKVFFSGDTDRLVQSVVVYESVQELHRQQETTTVAIDREAPADLIELYSTLPRVTLRRPGDGEADLTIFGHERAEAVPTAEAKRLWCWNAPESAYDELERAFWPGGFALANRDSALFYRTSPPVTQTAPPGAKHVLLYTDDPDSGGVAQYNHTILRGLVKAGYRVSCVQSLADNPLVAEQRELGVRHYWLDYHTTREFGRTVTDAALFETIVRVDRPDFVLFSDCCPVSNLAAREVAMQRSVPYAVVIGFVGEYLADRFATVLPMLGRQYAAAGAVVAVSQENLDLLRRRFGLAASAGVVIHYGRPGKFFVPRSAEARARLRAEIGVSEEATICFTAARLAQVKGYPYLIEAARKLARLPACKDLHFVWAGDGELRGQLEELVRKAGLTARIHFLGHRWDVDEWYDASDMFALPSDLEGMPLAIMEAMAKGLPVVATAVSGIPEELGTTGRLLTPAAQNRALLVNELVEALHLWTREPAQRAMQAQRAQRRAATMFQERMMLVRTIDLVQRFTGPAPTPPTVWQLSDTLLPGTGPFLCVTHRGGQTSFREFPGDAANRSASTARLVASAIEGEQLDDFEFIVNVADKPGNILDRVTFSYTTIDRDYSRVCPDFLFDAWKAVQIDDYEELCAELRRAGQERPSDARIGWIGVPMVAARQRLLDYAQAHPTILQAIDMEWDRADAERNQSPKYISLPDQVRRWKYLIDVEGYGWSARLKTFLFSGRVTFIAERPWKEWYFEHLQPWVHYVPVRRDLADLAENHRRIESDPKLQRKIIAAAQEFAARHLTRAAAIERWRELLRANFGAKPTPDAAINLDVIPEPEGTVPVALSV